MLNVFRSGITIKNLTRSRYGRGVRMLFNSLILIGWGNGWTMEFSESFSPILIKESRGWNLELIGCMDGCMDVEMIFHILGRQ